MTLRQRLREGRTEGTALRWSVTDIHREAADTIDALVAALVEERDTFEAIRHDMHSDTEIMQACRPAVDRIDSALALARGA